MPVADWSKTGPVGDWHNAAMVTPDRIRRDTRIFMTKSLELNRLGIHLGFNAQLGARPGYFQKSIDASAFNFRIRKIEFRSEFIIPCRFFGSHESFKSLRINVEIRVSTFRRLEPSLH